jgi:hypothetical protein
MGADASVGQLHQYLVVVVNGKVRPPMVAVPVTVTEPWAGMANEHFVGPGDLVFPFPTGGHRRGGEIRDMLRSSRRRGPGPAERKVSANPVPRPPPYVRHDRRPGVRHRRRSGVYGPPGHPNDDALRPPSTASRSRPTVHREGAPYGRNGSGIRPETCPEPRPETSDSDRTCRHVRGRAWRTSANQLVATQSVGRRFDSSPAHRRTRRLGGHRGALHRHCKENAPRLIACPEVGNCAIRPGAGRGGDLGLAGFLGQAERAPLRVLADRPLVPRMDHGAAKRLDSLGGGGDVAHLEVGERKRVPGAASSGMDAYRGASRMGLPAFALSGAAGLQRDAKQPLPESACPFGIVRGKLDK